MTLSDIDTMQATIVVGPANNDYLYRAKMLLQKGKAGAKSGWTTGAPDGLLRREVRPLPYGRECMSAPTARYLTTPSRNVLPIKGEHHEH